MIAWLYEYQYNKLNSHDLSCQCENEKITLTHDFNRGNMDKKQTAFVTVLTVLIIIKQTN